MSYLVTFILFLSFTLSSFAHTDNHAVIVSSSRYYHNYRHVGNALSIYQLLKAGSMPDSNIILMLADDIPCNARNPYPANIFTGGRRRRQGGGVAGSLGGSIYATAQSANTELSIEVDYRGADVTVDNFLRVLTGRHLPSTPSHQKLHTTATSNLLLFLTGHGGDGFFKFQDAEELLSQDLAAAFHHMERTGRYENILFVSDTCQAFTLSDPFLQRSQVKNVISIGSSLKNENSYAHHADAPGAGASVIDRFSQATTEFFHLHQHGAAWRDKTIHDWLQFAKYDKLFSNVGVRSTVQRGGRRDELLDWKRVPLSDFFADRQESLLAEQHRKKMKKQQKIGQPVQGLVPHLLDEAEFTELPATAMKMKRDDDLSTDLWHVSKTLPIMTEGVSLGSASTLTSRPDLPILNTHKKECKYNSLLIWVLFLACLKVSSTAWRHWLC